MVLYKSISRRSFANCLREQGSRQTERIFFFVDITSFLGLVSPYIVRRIIGDAPRFRISAAMSTGALIRYDDRVDLSSACVSGVHFYLNFRCTGFYLFDYQRKCKEIPRVNELYFRYNGVETSKQIRFSIEKGSITAILGPTGVRTITLLRYLNYVLHLCKGKVRIGDHVISAMILPQSWPCMV